jgi:drug/metabolite transporter (DMT)-like permease
MDWFVLALLSGLIFAVVELFDKFVLDNEVGDAYLSALFCKMPIFAVFIAVGLYFGEIIFSWKYILSGMMLVGLYIFSSYLYYRGIQMEEVSRFIPTLSINSVFIVVLSFVFLGERFGLQTYSGALLTILGAFLISMEDPGRRVIHNFKSTWAVAFGLGAAFLWAVRDLVIKTLTVDVNIFSILLWVGLIGLPVTLALISLKREEFEDGIKTGYEHLSLIGLMVSVGYLTFIWAIDQGPVSLVTVVGKVDSALIFIGSILATKFDPEQFHDELDKKVIIQKFIFLCMILSGIAIINLA